MKDGTAARAVLADAPAGAFWGALLQVLNLGDVLTTMGGIYFSSDFFEANPIMALLLRWPWVFVAVKLAAATLAVELCLRLGLVWPLKIGVAIFGTVCLWNCSMLLLALFL